MPVHFKDLVDAQGHAQCLLQQAINLNSARTHAHQVNSFKICTEPCPVNFEDFVDAQGHAQCLLQHAINLNNAHTCTSGELLEELHRANPHCLSKILWTHSVMPSAYGSKR
jgi:hypothetical protein